MQNIENRILLAIANVLGHTVRGNLSVVELFVFIACGVAAIGVVLNSYDVRQELRRAMMTNGAKLTLTHGAQRRVIADSIVVLSFFLLGILASQSPQSPDSQRRAMSTLSVLLILVPLLVKVYNQWNDYFTRRKATKQLDELYEQARQHVMTIAALDQQVLERESC